MPVNFKPQTKWTNFQNTITSKLIKDEVGNLNSLTAITEIFPQGLEIYMREFYQSFIKQIVLIFFKLLQKIEKERATSVTLMSKLDKNSIRKEY